jgi:hypothetical protein
MGALAAVAKLTVKLQFGRDNYVVEADIKGFFDRVDHEWRSRRLGERIDDRAFLGLIRKWLQAGIRATTGAILPPVTGPPQGGGVSPVLSNVYLPSVLDLWCEKVIKPQCRGEACVLRYADEYICAFEFKAEAERFYAALGHAWRNAGWRWRPRRRASCPSAARRLQARAAWSSWGLSCAGGRTERGKRICSGARRAPSCGRLGNASPRGARRIALGGSAECFRS